MLGVAYAENDGAPEEGYKAEALAAKSYALRRPDAMGYAAGLKIEEQNGQYILNIRNCTSDQVYCDPDKGCSTETGDTGNTVYSGATTKPHTYKPVLAQESYQRIAASEISDKILVDSTGNVFYATYTDVDQNRWNAQANSGQTYAQMLEATYSGAKVATIKCTYTNVTGGSCNTSTPLKLASGETSFSISSHFGLRNAPTAGASTNHGGIDIPANTGTPIYSVFEGTVAISEDDWGTAGNAVLITHDLDGDGITDYTTEYFHMSKRDVKVGDRVSGGQKIGEVGSTGASTGPHLHFGVRVGGTSDNRTDPEPIVNALITKSSVFDKAKICQASTTSKFTGTFPYYNQCVGDWSDHRICDGSDYVGGQCVAGETICTSGCGYTSFSMIASGFNNNSSITPASTVDYVSKYSFNPGGGAITNEALVNQNVLDYYKLNAEILFNDTTGDISNKKNQIVNALKAGKAVQVLVPGHYVAFVGIDSNGKIQLHDPGNSDNVGQYTIDEIHNLFKTQRSNRCYGGSCSDSEVFEYAIAYSRR